MSYVSASSPASSTAPAPRFNRSGTGGFYAVVSMLLGLLVAVLGFVAIFMWIDAHDAKKSADRAASKVGASSSMPANMPGMNMAGTAGSTQSFAGAAPANAAALAAAHKPYPAALPAAPAGPVADVHLVLKDVTVQIAPGVKYAAWAWAGGAPGPVIHVRQGQLVKITLTNGGAIPHSVDFHAARIAPNKAFGDVMPGKSVSYTFRANDPGVFMYHCGTKPVLMHIANGMYGAIVVDPPAGVLPKADRDYVLVASEWYLSSDGLKQPASLDMAKAHEMAPDWVTWNGYAAQYVKHPLMAKPGETVRFWVVDAGPSLNTDFHVVGALLNRAWVNADMTQYQQNVQTALVP